MSGWLGYQVRLLLVGIQFLTRIPTPHLPAFEEAWITRATRYFPLVGQIIGGLCAVVLIAADQIWSPWIAAALALAVGVALTGAFHEDGLADTADGLGGGLTPARRLEIMKDSRIGTYGAVTLVLALTLKILALSDMPVTTAAIALLAAHGAGRAAAVVVMRLTPYAMAGEAGKWKPTPQGVGTLEMVCATALALWPMILLPGSGVLAGLAGGGTLALVLTLVARRLIGGHTGDVLGAIEQVFEVGFLLGVAAVLA